MFNLFSFFYIRIKANRDKKFLKKHGYLLITGNYNDFIRVGVLFPGTPLIDLQERNEVFINENIK